MTDEERKKLCKELRSIGPLIGEVSRNKAADEIEWLAAELEKMSRWYNTTQKQLWAMRKEYGHD